MRLKLVLLKFVSFETVAKSAAYAVLAIEEQAHKSKVHLDHVRVVN